MVDSLDKKEIMHKGTLTMRRHWKQLVDEDTLPGRYTRSLIIPYFEDWLDRTPGITFYVTQLMTGHGSFGTYLFRIGKADTACCRYCGDPKDDPVHTYEQCPRWAVQRHELSVVLEEPVRWIRMTYWWLYAPDTRAQVHRYIVFIMRQKFCDELRDEEDERALRRIVGDE